MGHLTRSRHNGQSRPTSSASHHRGQQAARVSNSVGDSSLLDSVMTASQSGSSHNTLANEANDLQEILAQGLLGGTGLSHDQINSYYHNQMQSTGNRHSHGQYSISMHDREGHQSVSASY